MLLDLKSDLTLALVHLNLALSNLALDKSND